MLLYIASSREIGTRCFRWAKDNLPAEWGFTDDPEMSDVFISVMYGHLVSEEFISKRRCYNFHPGLLPQYRGAGAFSWTIINGEKRCGITLHELDVDIDTGPIICRYSFPVEAWDTAESLHKYGMEYLYDMFQNYFHRLLNNDYGKPKPQSELGDGYTYYRKDLNKVMDLTKYVRALTFEGKEPAYYIDRDGKKVEMKW